MHVYVLPSYLRTTLSSDNRVAVNQRKQIKYRLLRVCETQQTTLEVNEVFTLTCFHTQTLNVNPCTHAGWALMSISYTPVGL